MKQSRSRSTALDCFASLAMTDGAIIASSSEAITRKRYDATNSPFGRRYLAGVLEQEPDERRLAAER